MENISFLKSTFTAYFCVFLLFSMINRYFSNFFSIKYISEYGLHIIDVFLKNISFEKQQNLCRFWLFSYLLTVLVTINAFLVHIFYHYTFWRLLYSLLSQSKFRIRSIRQLLITIDRITLQNWVWAHFNDISRHLRSLYTLRSSLLIVIAV